MKQLKAIFHNRPDGATMQIVEQTHRGNEFGAGSNEFTASNGICFVSINFPDQTGESIYVRGLNKEEDSREFVFEGDKAQILKAIEEYNQLFSKDIVVVSKNTQVVFKYPTYTLIVTEDGVSVLPDKK